MFRITEKHLKKIKCDAKDKKILVLLAENSKITINELAKKVQLKRDTISYRIKRMEEKGLIIKYYPEIDYQKLGFNQYHIFFSIDERNENRKEEFIKQMQEHYATINLIEYSDRWDFEWTLVAKNIVEFDNVVSEIQVEFSDIILERSKLLHRNTFYSILLPFNFHEIKRKPIITKQSKQLEIMKIDKIDVEILKELSFNARASSYEISKKINLSGDAIRTRIKKLERNKIIKKYTVLLNLSMLGYHWFTFVTQLKIFNEREEKKFETLVENHQYIIKAVKTLGEWDVIIDIIADSQKDFHKTIKELKTEFSDTIIHYDTYIAYKEHAFYPFPKRIYVN